MCSFWYVNPPIQPINQSITALYVILRWKKLYMISGILLLCVDNPWSSFTFQENCCWERIVVEDTCSPPWICCHKSRKGATKPPSTSRQTPWTWTWRRRSPPRPLWWKQQQQQQQPGSHSTHCRRDWIWSRISCKWDFRLRNNCFGGSFEGWQRPSSLYLQDI